MAENSEFANFETPQPAVGPHFPRIFSPRCTRAVIFRQYLANRLASAVRISQIRNERVRKQSMPGATGFVNIRASNTARRYNMRECFRFIHEFQDINPVSCFSAARPRPRRSVLRFVAPYLAQNVRSRVNNTARYSHNYRNTLIAQEHYGN